MCRTEMQPSSRHSPRKCPFLHTLGFDVVRRRFSDEEIEKISIWDEYDRPVAEEVEFYACLIANLQEVAKD